MPLGQSERQVILVDIESILSSLGLDLTNPEVKKGAMEAIDAILGSRQSLDGLSGGGSGGGEQDIEIDPDLLQPSIKNSQQENSDDIEINDEEDILKDVKHNDSDESQDTPMSNDTENGDSEDESADQAGDMDEPSSSGSSDSVNDSDSASVEQEIDTQEGDQENSSSVDIADEESEVEYDDANEVQDDEEDLESISDDDSDNSDEEVYGSSDDESDFDDNTDAADEETEQSDDEFEIDENDLLDDTLKDPYEDQAEKAKHEARRIKRERTLNAAKNALAAAQAKNKAPALIRELEKAIEALESLQEAAKNIKDLSDEEFNLMVNRVFDAIDALGDSGLTYTSDEERQLKAQEIKNDIANRQTQAELSAEDVAQIRAETQAIKAREKEKAKYAPKSRGSFKGFQDFLNSLYRAIALQVHTEETRDDSWSAISRRNSGAGVLQQGKKFNELPNKKIPIIDFYFDQSGSWDESDIRVGEKAVAALAEMEEKGQIKINIYYFANNVHTDAASARREGGTWAWNDIVKNIIATQATNVIIMTDSDMENRWDREKYWDQGSAAAYTVPGYVWYLWRYGDNAPRLPRDLKGRGGTQQFSFGRGGI